VSADATAAAVQDGSRVPVQTVAGQPLVTAPAGAPPATQTPATQTPATQPSAASRKSLANSPPDPEHTEKKPSFFSKMKAKIMKFVTKHPVLAGAIIGGMLGALGGPAFFVIGMSLGAVAGDTTSYLFKKYGRSST
jgi:hypothetical protein